MSRRAIALLCVGLLAMAGDVLGVPALKGIGAASGMSPAPKVFSAVQGYETWTTAFRLEYQDPAGTTHRVELTPEVAARMRGPYNRRNVFGALVAYGPVLAENQVTQPLFFSVARYALCGQAVLLREVGIDPAQVAGPVTLTYIPREGGSMGPFADDLVLSCQ